MVQDKLYALPLAPWQGGASTAFVPKPIIAHHATAHAGTAASTPWLNPHITGVGHAALAKLGAAKAAAQAGIAKGVGVISPKAGAAIAGAKLGVVGGSALGAALGAGAGYLTARAKNAWNRRKGKGYDRNSYEWHRMRNKYMKRGALAGGAAGLATGLLSKTAYEYDPETRQFGILNKAVGVLNHPGAAAISTGLGIAGSMAAIHNTYRDSKFSVVFLDNNGPKSIQVRAGSPVQAVQKVKSKHPYGSKYRAFRLPNEDQESQSYYMALES